MSNLGLILASKPSNSVIVSFRIPYFTHWGQQILVCGSERILGSWDVKKGLLLKPSHQGDELIWCGTLSVPAGFTCEYSYYVVDDKKNVIRWEAGKKRKMSLPNSAQHGQLVELHDLWQVPNLSVFASHNIIVVIFLVASIFYIECIFFLEFLIWASN